jgi:pyruvate dehydrogenase E1 component alpha subunit
VKNAADEAVKYVREGNGPILLEMKTYRYRGHSMSDPAKYRSKDEVAVYKEQRDPIENLKGFMVKNGYADEEAFKAIEKDVKEIVNDAAEFAKTSPEPDPSELYTDVLV